MRRVDTALLISVALLIIVLVVWGFSGMLPSEDKVRLAPAESRVSIGVLTAISLSANLVDGIDFGTIEATQIPVTDRAASDNANGPSSSTTLAVTRDPSSTVDLEICINADQPLTENVGGISTIPLVGETYSFSTSPTPSGPAGSVPLTTSGVKASSVLSSSSANENYRFWLDVPSGSYDAGTYTNTITFTAVQAGSPCP